MFSGNYYKLKRARLGNKVRAGEAVQVGPLGQAKLTFSNGDQFIVGPGTTYSLDKVSSKKGKGKKGSLLKIFYGKMRGIVSKTGPRNRLKIKTRGVIAGVRGTDFFISSAPNKVDVTVLRGGVAIEKVQGVKKELIIKTGMSAGVAPKSESKKVEKKQGVKETVVEKIVIRETSKQDFLGIQKASKVNVKEMLKNIEADEAVVAEIQKLEVKAKVAVITDIKTESNEMAEKVAKLEGMDPDKLNSQVIFGLYKKAPEEAKPKKLSEKELDLNEEQIYNQFFK